MCAFPDRYSVCMIPRFLYLDIVVCTDARGTLSCLEIAPNEEPDCLVLFCLFFTGRLAELIGFSRCTKGEKGAGSEGSPLNIATGARPVNP